MICAELIDDDIMMNKEIRKERLQPDMKIIISDIAKDQKLAEDVNSLNITAKRLHSPWIAYGYKKDNNNNIIGTTLLDTDNWVMVCDCEDIVLENHAELFRCAIDAKNILVESVDVLVSPDLLALMQTMELLIDDYNNPNYQGFLFNDEAHQMIVFSKHRSGADVDIIAYDI